MQNNNDNNSQDKSQDKHLYILPHIFIDGVSHQDLINSKISYYGSMYTKNIPKNWLEDKK